MILPRILTASGRYFDFLSPDPESIVIEDIATALSRICRFTGHTTRFYSVAQHSVLVSYLVPPEYALQGLLHDASEAYLGDVSSPLKQLLPDYKAIEQRVESAILGRFGLSVPLHPSIKDADVRALVTERRDFMPKPAERYRVTDSVAWSWTDGVEATAAVPLPTFNPAVARVVFLARYEELTKEG
ncbi:metal-dependent phosphohydrolase [Burkholderia lata]|uniref:metal-dependent phosphohydrolase n=1 Tax=Burkholderia lata (strain ATCC 17760 / DSM 23089 / LMG 22485 / NCIMB 9086 / R18194 / 383) TaxID=482957 RepID=UPI001E3091C1|nr:metal-dependent phosphohydrolase [Burkholderia lata]